MKQFALGAALLLAAQPGLATISLRQNDDDNGQAYVDMVCRPAVEDGADNSAESVAPCIAVEVIESACLPNGTSPLAYDAHAQCMCKGSYFSQWRGCQQCLFFHGIRSESDFEHFVAAMSIASAALCTGKPTAAFQDLFTSADYEAPHATTAATVLSDLAPSDTDIDLYFTPTASSWGPGPITGSATAATATVPKTTSEEVPSTTSGGGEDDDSAETVSSTSTPLTTSSPTGMAAPTAAPGGAKGMLLAMAGGALVAVL